MHANTFVDEADSLVEQRLAVFRWKGFITLCIFLSCYVLLDVMAVDLAFVRGFDPVALLLVPAECTVAFIVFRRTAEVREMMRRTHGTGIVGMCRRLGVASTRDPDAVQRTASEMASLRAFLWDGICGRGWVLPLDTRRPAVGGRTVREGDSDLVTAAALRSARISARRTQEWLAHHSGVSVRTISRAETSGRISFVNFQALCGALDMTLPVAVAQTEPGSPYPWVSVLLWVRRFLAGVAFGPADPAHTPDALVRIGIIASMLVILTMSLHFLLIYIASQLPLSHPMFHDAHNMTVVMSILGSLVWGSVFMGMISAVFLGLVADGFERATASRKKADLVLIALGVTLVFWQIRSVQVWSDHVFDRLRIAHVAEITVDDRLVAEAHGNAALLARSRYFEENKIGFALFGMHPPSWMVDERAWQEHERAKAATGHD